MKFLIRSIVASAVLALAASMPTTAGAAPSQNERFVRSLYDDFLFREPTAVELATAVSQLDGGGARSSVVNSLLTGPEFAMLWSYGVYDRYLDRFPTDAEERAAVAQGVAGSYTSVEVAALASGEFYARAGSTPSGFVELLYDRLLGRPSDPGGLAYWTGKLAAGTSRASVATSFIRLGESARRRVGGAGVGVPCTYQELSEPAAVVAGSYCIVLDRPADQSGFDYWVGQMAGSGQLPTLWRSQAASNEYYAHV